LNHEGKRNEVLILINIYDFNHATHMVRNSPRSAQKTQGYHYLFLLLTFVSFVPFVVKIKIKTFIPLNLRDLRALRGKKISFFRSFANFVV